MNFTKWASLWAGLVCFCPFRGGQHNGASGFVMSAYYPMLYFFLVLAAVYSFMNQWGLATMFCLLGAGLVRPEAWLFPPVIYSIDHVKKERGFRCGFLFLCLLPLCGAV